MLVEDPVDDVRLVEGGHHRQSPIPERGLADNRLWIRQDHQCPAIAPVSDEVWVETGFSERGHHLGHPLTRTSYGYYSPTGLRVRILASVSSTCPSDRMTSKPCRR